MSLCLSVCMEYRLPSLLLETLTNTNSELVATIERLEEEKDEEIQRVQELMMESAKIQLANEKL